MEGRVGSARVTRLLAAAFSLLAFASGAARAASCDAWPGEPAPLPTLDDPDSLRAEWANLRSLELAQVAQRFEAQDPLRAQQLWRRLLCMDPANDQALAGVLRSQAIRVHRPPLLNAPFDEARVRDPWEMLDAAIGVGGGSAQQRAILAKLRELRSQVGALEEQVRSARFEEALVDVPGLRKQLAVAPAGSTRTNLIVQTEVLAATAELALGRATGAEASLERALDADPDLVLDPATTPRKVLRAFDAVLETR
jgi:hypothetical protein